MARLRWKQIFSRKVRILNKADAARDRRDAETAAYLYQKAIDCWGGGYPVLMQLGNALKDSGRYADAERTYRDAIAIRPREDDTFLQLGHLMKLSGDIGRAEEFYGEAYAINPLCTDAGHELDMIAASRASSGMGLHYTELRTDMPLPASVVYSRLTNQYRWRRG